MQHEEYMAKRAKEEAEASKKDWTVGVMSDLVFTGISEDGEQVIRESFYVTLTNSFGDRYRSNFSSFDKVDVEVHAKKVAHYLALGHSPVGSPKWSRHLPVFGSPAYEEYGSAEEVALERKNAR